MQKDRVLKIPKTGIVPGRGKSILFFCLVIIILSARPVLSSTLVGDIDTVGTAKKEYLIKGSVFDEKGLPMPGVTVLLDSTKIGVTTDSEGAFLLRLPDPKGQLVFSFVGYKTLRVPFEAGKPITIHMKEELSRLDEVTVVAYGEQSRRNIIGAMSTVRADEIKDIPTPSLANLLQGRVAGMSVLNTSGAPGGGGIVTTIRGFNSLSVEASQRHSEPLWVIDGVPMYSFTSPITGLNTLSEIDPKDIETVQVLKDAASAAIYGSRAANGVILVTTKKGRLNQKARVSLNVSQTFIFSPSLPDLIGGNLERKVRMEALKNQEEAYYDFENNIYKYPTSFKESHENGAKYNYFWNAGDGATIPLYQDSLNPFYNNSTDLYDYYFRTAKVTDANIQVSGGGESIAYNIGLGYYDETGVLRGTGFGRVKLLSNLFITPVKNMNMNLRFYLARTDRSRKSSDQNGFNFTTGSELERIPSELLETSTLYPGKGTPAFEEMIKRYE
ncbi:MAG: TonB-dependent receptor plug domain-containing protein, partial [Butyricimonas virosa]